MSSNCRRVLPRQHLLKRQVSLIDSISNTSLLFPRNHELAIRRSDRFKNAYLQKQFSVDQIFGANRGARHKSAAGRGSAQRGSASKDIASSTCKTTNGYLAPSANGQNSVVTDENIFDINLKSDSATKKRVQHQKGNGDNKKDRVNAERMRKSSKAGDDRYNLKIFLDQNIPAKDTYEIAGSESSDDSESDNNSDSAFNVAKKQDAKEVNEEPVVQAVIRQVSASSRRAQFRASRIADGSSSGNPTNTLLPPSERRPPLVRAMSAPVRPRDENNKTILVGKRKSRRRKITSQRSTTSDQVNENIIIQSKKPETNAKSTEPSIEKHPKKPVTKSRPSQGADVVTLVSLISSEGSDTEKEESIIIIDSGRIRRPPLLRKSGKSVSFQERELDSFGNIPREFPHIMRRGSVAPLAARIFSNRPPTAPAGSIYMRAFEKSESKMSAVIRSSSKEDITTIITAQGNSKENIPANVNASSSDIQYPEYVRTMKERECWKLFQKMSSKGISVSYDTVLRGMLTPTELRLVQKQKELEAARKAREDEEAETKN